jgi:hypothetical protein
MEEREKTIAEMLQSYEAGVYGPVNLVDGLYEVARALHRIAEAIENSELADDVKRIAQKDDHWNVGNRTIKVVPRRP